MSDTLSAKEAIAYDRTAKEIGDVPIFVANDGDVSVLIGSATIIPARQIGRETENGLVEEQ